jgi:hypothetical protein|tara:strand:- start:811 stop:1347 length:537 start_codon:yes stop_codon:yes gene_type:complete
MALWGNNDNVGSAGTVSLNYATRVVTGTATSFGIAGGCSEGDVIRFGIRGQSGGIYHGDAVIVSIANSESLTIGSTMGLSGVAIAGTDFSVSQLPKSSVLDSKFSEASYGTNDSLVYGVNQAAGLLGSNSAYYGMSEGWVGVTTYVDGSGNLRVKKETLVAMSGITTAPADFSYPTPE